MIEDLYGFVIMTPLCCGGGDDEQNDRRQIEKLRILGSALDTRIIMYSMHPQISKWRLRQHQPLPF